MKVDKKRATRWIQWETSGWKASSRGRAAGAPTPFRSDKIIRIIDFSVKIVTPSVIIACLYHKPSNTWTTVASWRRWRQWWWRWCRTRPTWSADGGTWPVTYKAKIAYMVNNMVNKANMVNMVGIWRKVAFDPLNMFDIVNVATWSKDGQFWHAMQPLALSTLWSVSLLFQIWWELLMSMMGWPKLTNYPKIKGKLQSNNYSLAHTRQQLLH